MDRREITTGTIWEQRVGYARAVRMGPHIHVAGTLAIDDDGNLVGEHDAGAQTTYILRKIERALTEAGASLADVVGIRMYVIRPHDQEAVGDAHAGVFAPAGIRPASTMIGVPWLAHPGAMVEIEAEAISLAT